jgi:ubiquinone/menaquinone biosynthesis C-methylase UbiE
MKQAWQQLVRFGFRLLYQEMAWSYDAVSWLVSLGQWRRWQEAALDFLPAATAAPRVLELGHGPGHMLLALAERGYRPIGLDLSPQMGRMAWRRVNGRTPLLRASVTAVPLADNSVDAVLATFPTDYVIEPRTIAQVKRVLGENGRLVILPQAQLTGRGPIHRLIELAFRITGQRAVFSEQYSVFSEPLEIEGGTEGFGPLAEALAAGGFAVRQHVVRLPGSVALIIVARMSTSDSTAD